MRATLWQGATEASEILREVLRGALFGLAGIPLDVVSTGEDLLAAAAQARRASDNDILVIDCVEGLPGDIDRCVPIVTRTKLSVHIVHPREATVRALEDVAGRTLVWLPSDATLYDLIDKLHVLRALVAAEKAAVLDRPTLTPRRREVLRLVGERYTTPQIAWQLDISESTVKAHVRSLKDIFGVETRQDLRTINRRMTQSNR